MGLMSWEIGDRVTSELFRDGPRVAFDHILGFSVAWDAEQLELAELDPKSEEAQKS